MQNTTFDCILKGIQPKQLFDISKVSEQSELQSDDFDKLLKKYNYTRDTYNMMLEFLKTRSFVFNEENNKNAFENALKVAEKKSTTYTNFEIIYLLNKELAKTNEYKHTIAEKEYDKNRESVADAVLSGKTEMKEENKNTYERNESR